MKKKGVTVIIITLFLLNTLIISVSGININTKNEENLSNSEEVLSGDFLTIYDFKNITSPSSNHKGSYCIKIKDLNDKPPNTGPIVDDIIEFSTNEYTKIYNSDNNRIVSSSSIGKQLHHFQFNIKEKSSEIKSLHVRWIGYTSNTHTNLYIWNFKNDAWDLVGINRFTHSDAIISKTYINGISNYVDDTNGNLYLIAITRAATIFKQRLCTNYVQVKVGNPDTITLKDDAYHFNNEKNYIEWWFFDVINEAQDIQFFIGYHVLNPTGGFATVDLGIFEKDKIYEVRNYYSTSEFFASYDKPYVKIGNCIIDAINENTFLIKGSAGNIKNSVIWNITLIRTAPPYDFVESAGEMQYLCYIPGAWVKGTIELNGVIYSMDNSYGYHDHNWGGGPFLPCRWAWAVACKPEDEFALAMEKVEHFKWYTRALYVTLGENTYYFEDIETKFEEFKLKFKPSFPFFTYYPMIRHIHSENGEGYEIDFTATVQKNIPIFMGNPRVLNEQVSLFIGTLSKDNQVIYSFNVHGFTDYSIG